MKTNLESLPGHVLRFPEWKKAVKVCFPKSIAQKIIKNKKGEWWQVMLIQKKIGEMVWGK